MRITLGCPEPENGTMLFTGGQTSSKKRTSGGTRRMSRDVYGRALHRETSTTDGRHPRAYSSLQDDPRYHRPNSSLHHYDEAYRTLHERGRLSCPEVQLSEVSGKQCRNLKKISTMKFFEVRLETTRNYYLTSRRAELLTF